MGNSDTPRVYTRRSARHTQENAGGDVTTAGTSKLHGGREDDVLKDGGDKGDSDAILACERTRTTQPKRREDSREYECAPADAIATTLPVESNGTTSGGVIRDVNRLKRRSAGVRRHSGSSMGVPNSTSPGRILKRRKTGRTSRQSGQTGRSPSRSLPDTARHVPTFSAEEMNNLKKDIEDLKREKAIITDCADEYKQKNLLLIEEVASLKVQLLSSEKELDSVMANDGKKKLRKKRTSRRESYRVYGSMFVEEKVPTEFISAFQDCTDKVAAMVQYVVRESVPSVFEKVFSPVGWYPNEPRGSLEECRDWRGRITYIDGSRDSSVVGNSGRHPRGASFMSTRIDSSGDEVAFNGCIPLCIMEQAQKGEFFTANDAVIRRVVGQYVLKEVMSTNTGLTPKQQSNVFNLASSSPALIGLMNGRALQAGVGTRKSAARVAYFTHLGYKRVVVACSKLDLDGVHTARIEEEKLASSRLIKFVKAGKLGEHDTSHWRKALFPEICFPGAVEPKSPKSTSSEIDMLFHNIPARLAYVQWVGYTVNPDDDTTLMSLIRLDAWMTVMARHMGRRKEGQSLRGGGHTTWMKREFRRLLPIAAQNLLQEVTDIVRKAVPLSFGSTFDDELTVGEGINEDEILGNDTRKLTSCFRYPRNKHYYVSLLPEAFTDYVCKWMGRVSDCYLVHTPRPGVTETQFLASEVVHYVHESDEEPALPAKDVADDSDVIDSPDGKNEGGNDDDSDLSSLRGGPQSLPSDGMEGIEADVSVEDTAEEV